MTGTYCFTDGSSLYKHHIYINTLISETKNLENKTENLSTNVHLAIFSCLVASPSPVNPEVHVQFIVFSFLVVHRKRVLE